MVRSRLRGYDSGSAEDGLILFKMKKEVVELQKKMYEEGMDAYYIPSSDFHGSEYVHSHFRCREFISGFDGSAGEMLVTEDAAYLWTDGRYFLQAEQQLAGTGIKLMKQREEGVPTVIEFISALADEYLASHESNFVIGFDGRVVKDDFGFDLESALSVAGAKHTKVDGQNEDDIDFFERIRIKWDEDLVGLIWKERPAFDTHGLWQLPIESAGIPASEKIKNVRAVMEDEEAEYLLLSDLAGIAWLLNMRGSDIAYTPLFYAYVLICPDCVNVYLTDAAIKSGAEELIRKSIGTQERINIKHYDDVYADVGAADVSEDGYFMTDNALTYSMYLSMPQDAMFLESDSAVEDVKMIKNDVEIRCSKEAHIRDGAAVTKFIAWLKSEMKNGASHTEISAADYLEKKRKEQDGFIELSFPTIAGYAANGAIVHYEAEPGKEAKLKPEGFLLVDSGAHYIDGTTDITRTIALGPLTQEMKDDYTYVLKSHIAYARMRYEEGMSGRTVDEMVRKPLKDAGLDFNHGISHGVGHVLSVHENAAVIRPTNELDAWIRSGMIMSDEPGVYKEDRYGIRTENLVCFKDDGTGVIVNEPLTCVPYEREAINKDLLTEDEIEWINSYHKWVRETLTPLLDKDTTAFLEKETKAI